MRRPVLVLVSSLALLAAPALALAAGGGNSGGGGSSKCPKGYRVEQEAKKVREAAAAGFARSTAHR